MTSTCSLYAAPAAGPREIHLVDIENLLSGPRFTSDCVRACRREYTAVAGVAAMAHVIIGSSACGSMLESGLGWPTARRVWLRGADGAERALIDVATAENIAGRFQRVVIGSGDGIFAALASNLQSAGCHVTVVSRRSSLSRRLRLAVRDVRLLSDHTAVAVASTKDAA